ncbi:hypothetical protein [Janthinobacterium lividum]|uniref:hypothetical protein n=1 Tax=Janthinobacterium lividum TaxID=29581 RepID=UPI0008753FC8|nr:hypothetical protein [Janthinobacterium lividum]MCC7716732.1 hypothetical protein [Janthinobacterium lividum]WQE31800.1 hypothetical protein U0004_29760 [Janthinobacterium lividum]
MINSQRVSIRDNLLKSMAALFSGQLNSDLTNTLLLRFPALSFALVINWIPEQGEDIYFVLVDEKRIVVIEVPRTAAAQDAFPVVDSLNVADYRNRKLSVDVRRKLDEALILMREKAGTSFD